MQKNAFQTITYDMSYLTKGLNKKSFEELYIRKDSGAKEKSSFATCEMMQRKLDIPLNDEYVTQ